MNTSKGYKASYKGKCLTLTYEVGKTYSIDKISICNYGFHFCKEMKDVVNYYLFNNNNFILFEVEALGQIITENDKSVTDKLKIIRIVPKDEYTFPLPLQEYDQNNNLIHYKNSNGFEYWKEYDQNNNLIHSKNSNGFEEWKEYDQNNNCIHFKNSKGFEKWQEYDQNNNLIHFKNSKGYEYNISIE